MLPTELLCEIVSFLYRNDVDVLQLVNAAVNALVLARFDDFPLRSLNTTADALGIRVEEQPVEAGRFTDVSLFGQLPEHVAPLLERCTARSFISHLTLE